MVKLSLSGMGAGSIAKKLNEENISTKASKFYHRGINLKDKYTGEVKFKNKNQFIWKQGTIERLLKSPLYKGERHYKELTLECPALIDANTWQKVQDNFIKNRNYSGRNNSKHFYLLKGLIFCNRCGRTLIGRISENKGMNIYFCMSKRSEEAHFCGMKSLNISKLNNLVWEKLLYVLTNSSLIRQELKKRFENTKSNQENVQHEISVLKNRLKDTEPEKDNLIRLARKGLISDRDLKKQLDEIEKIREQISKDIKGSENKISMMKKEQGMFSWISQIEDKAKELYLLNDDNKNGRYSGHSSIEL